MTGGEGLGRAPDYNVAVDVESAHHPQTTDNYAYRSPLDAVGQAPFTGSVQLTGTTRSVNTAGGGPDPVLAYAAASQSANTIRAYQTDVTDYLEWGGSMPASSQELVRYLADRAQHLVPATLRRRLAGLTDFHRQLGRPDPAATDLVHRVMRGIARVHGRRARQVHPLTPELLAEVVASLGSGVRAVRDRALLLVGYFGALRRSELVAIDWEACRGGPSGEVVVLVRRSKTDPAGVGREVVLIPTHDLICPVNAIQTLHTVTPSTTGAVFRSGRKRLSDQTVARVIKRRLKAVGIDSTDFSGHSMRAGYITTRAVQGMNGALIARQSGHRSQDQLATYIRVPPIPRRLSRSGADSSEK